MFYGNIKGNAMKLIITIDVEEDNWGTYDRYNYSVKNVDNIPKLQCVFDKYQVIPTYLINYPVANNIKAKEIFRDILKSNNCEIGAHIHPWNTPPFDGENGNGNSMLCNLPEGVQYNKVKYLNDLLVENFEIIPISFRAGRWGFNYTVAKNLYTLGYRYDTSITPFTNWAPVGGPDDSKIDSKPYYIFNHIENDGSSKYLLEIPPTIGYCGLFRKYEDICNRMHCYFNYKNRKYSYVNSLMRRLNIYEKIWLSPESSTLKEMIQLTESIRNKSIYLNMFFHSGSLMAGNTPYVTNIKLQNEFFNKIDLYLDYITNLNIESIRMSDANKYIQA